ncbi:hypothetical protein [Nocardia camponoti]|uniref:Uncharacterized protein n=1 Tax=Nocardia camponoti TaxID=1616106 RepID=A0A917V9B2_9NOCA|nr:hypothetical protein [Nocardia camponoti]GGK51175.1 hypothetical protein GCM10011591_23430 [Nocardia camponoti]
MKRIVVGILLFGGMLTGAVAPAAAQAPEPQPAASSPEVGGRLDGIARATPINYYGGSSPFYTKTCTYDGPQPCVYGGPLAALARLIDTGSGGWGIGSSMP